MIKIIAAMAITMAIPLGAAAQRQIVVERQPTPKTLAGMTETSNLVAMVRILSVREVGFRFEPYPRPESPYIEYQAEILDVPVGDTKRQASAGSRITILEVGTLEVHEAGFPPFVKGQELLLFLQWADKPFFAYMATHGPDGAFDVTDGLLRPLGRSRFAQSLSSKPRVSVLEQLRTMSVR